MIKGALRSFRAYWVQDVSFVTLLLMLIFTIFIMPTLLEVEMVGIQSFDVMLSVIFFVGIWSADNKKLIVSSGVLFVLFLMAKFVYPVEHSIFELVVACMCMAVNILINFRLLFRNGNFNLERVLGAVNVYLFIALLGAFLFDLIQLVLGSSITGELSLTGTGHDFIHYIYFSMASLTTVGFGDIIPVNYAARMLSVGLAAVGILYPAVVIAKLVSLGTDQGGFRRAKQKDA
ncbi:MAG: ion channel [Sphingobacteriaceae bacterium]|nr:ion channel [Sphingobacteriaceae bacterium]